MRNLRVLGDSSWASPLRSEFAPPLVCALENDCVAVLNADGLLAVHSASGFVRWQARLSTGRASYLELVFLAETRALFVACAEGSIATVALAESVLDGRAEEAIECYSRASDRGSGGAAEPVVSPPPDEVIGIFDCGLCCALWCSDQSLLLLVTPERKITVMTQSFDTFTECSVFESNAGASKLAARGTPHDAAAVADEVQQMAWAGRRVPAVWRSDAQCFAICAPTGALPGSSPQLRIYSQDGVLQGHGRHEDGSDVVGMYVDVP